MREMRTFTRQRFQVAEIRGLNAKVPKRAPGVGVPRLDDEQLLLALDEYVKKQRPVFEHRAKYPKFRRRLEDREWVEDGIHVFLGYKRAFLAGIDPKQRSQEGRQGQRPAASRRPRTSAPVNLAAAPVKLGAAFEQDTMVVRSVSAGSIAARLLLQPGDRVVRVDAQPIASLNDLRAVLATLAPGLHTFELVRSNEVVTATVTHEPRGPPST